MHYGPYLETYISPWLAYSRKGDRIGCALGGEDPNGGDSQMVLEYVRRCIAQKQRWNLVLLNCGLWDIRDRQGTLQTDLVQYTLNLTEIIGLLPRICDRWIWVRTTPVDDALHNSLKTDYWRHDADVVRYNEAADEVVTRVGATVIDLYQFCVAVGLSTAFADHIHFTDEMRRVQAAFIAGQVIALLRDTA